MRVAIIGLGIVGDAMYKSFFGKGMILDKNLFVYDKFKKIGKFNSCIDTDIIFLALPTPYDEVLKGYDISAIIKTCVKLEENNCNATIVIKSTVEPGTTYKLSTNFKKLSFVHNPEFLKAKTAFYDFHNQSHIVLGKSILGNDDKYYIVREFYKNYYPDSEISLCTALESESMKCFLNSFYAIKVQFFTELFLLCKLNGSNFDEIKNLMLKNDQIDPSYTQVAGPDGQISYGGMCFPKDTNALNKYMERLNAPNAILNATINERNTMRDD